MTCIWNDNSVYQQFLAGVVLEWEFVWKSCTKTLFFVSFHFCTRGFALFTRVTHGMLIKITSILPSTINLDQGGYGISQCLTWVGRLDSVQAEESRLHICQVFEDIFSSSLYVVKAFTYVVIIPR